MIRRRLVHHALLVGQLTDGRGAGCIDEDRGIDLGVAGGNTLVEEKLDEGAHDAGAVAHVEREAGACDLGATGEIEQALKTGDFPMRAGMGRSRGGVAIGGTNLVFLGGPALWDAGMRDIGQGQHRMMPLLLQALEAFFAGLHLGGNGLHLLHLGEELGRTLLQGNHLVVGRLLLGAKLLDLGQLGAPSGIDRQHGVEIGIKMLLGNGRPDDVGRFAEETGIEHERES